MRERLYLPASLAAYCANIMKVEVMCVQLSLGLHVELCAHLLFFPWAREWM